MAKCKYCAPDEIGDCSPLRNDEWAAIFLNQIGVKWFLQTIFYGGKERVGCNASVRVRCCPMCGRRL